MPSNMWLYRIISCSHPSVLYFRRPLNSGLPSPQHTLCILYPDHPLFVHTLYYVFVPIFSLSTPVIVAGQSSTRQLCVCIYTAPSLSSVFEPSYFDFCFLCINTDHTLYSVFVLGSLTILFSGNDLVWWCFISGSSRLQLLYSVFSRIIASSSPLLFVLNGPSHFLHIYLVLLYRESPRSSTMHFSPDHSLFSLYSRSVHASGPPLLGPLFSPSGISLLCPLYHY